MASPLFFCSIHGPSASTSLLQPRDHPLLHPRSPPPSGRPIPRPFPPARLGESFLHRTIWGAAVDGRRKHSRHAMRLIGPLQRVLFIKKQWSSAGWCCRVGRLTGHLLRMVGCPASASNDFGPLVRSIEACFTVGRSEPRARDKAPQSMGGVKDQPILWPSWATPPLSQVHSRSPYRPSRPADRRTGGPADQRTGGPADQRTGEPADQRPADQRTSGPADRRTGGPADRRTGGPADRRTGGPADQRTGELADQRTSGPCSGPADRRTSGPADRRTSGPADQQAGEPASADQRGSDQRTSGPAEQATTSG